MQVLQNIVDARHSLRHLGHVPIMTQRIRMTGSIESLDIATSLMDLLDALAQKRHVLSDTYDCPR